MFRYEDCTLVTEYGAVSFETPIRQAIEIGGVFIVCLGLMGREDDLNNIYGVKDGEIVWRVQDQRMYNPDFADPHLSPRALYGLIGPLENGSNLFFGTTGYGDCFRIDSQTGKIVGYEGWFK